MGGVAGILVAVFGFVFIGIAGSAGAPPAFTLFGVLFVVLAIVASGVSFYNATAKNRMSSLDITEDGEEPDPIARVIRGESKADSDDQAPSAKRSPRQFKGDYCPYCGNPLEADFDFCPKCGKDI